VSIDVTLSREELELASMIGSKRHLNSMARGSQPAHGFQGDGLSIHVEGAAAEIAVAKALGLYWPATVDSYSAADIGDDIQVRLRRKHEYELIVRPGDSDSHRYVHVTGTMPHFVVHGYIQGAAAKRPEWLRSYANRPAAHFVPTDALEAL
jgi:hypothetical protein